ncbi:MAG: polyprenyl synthetase family protein [Prevotellaceae bacterium]|nr:polyprenyl synthetase family protein [Prevotella sp.]MDD7530917.1 polyprenyl synthetase family protein [Prevotellaceae bacterium]MDY2633009.1 polyprenyl synthetase family protein [Prevotella sp.]
MDYLSIIKKPIATEINDFIGCFNEALSYPDGLLADALDHIRQQGGKRMRPFLTLLLAKNFGSITEVTQQAAVGLELLHTASLVHDDVVDESAERRGQPSVNASYNNKVAVLVGDYILSTALLRVAYTHNQRIVEALAELGRTLSNGEILQLNNFENGGISEETYFRVIEQKTAALFETCAEIAALSVRATEEEVKAAKNFGRTIGVIFQIRDDIFDYYDSKEIGKPTGNDMLEGKLTLPVIYALTNHASEEMNALAKKVKEGSIRPDEIGILVEFTKKNGGIDYAERQMNRLHEEALGFIATYVKDESIADALRAYIDFVIQRNK